MTAQNQLELQLTLDDADELAYILEDARYQTEMVLYVLGELEKFIGGQ